MAVGKSRRYREEARQALSLFLCICLLWLALPLGFQLTPKGIQCPTAPIQHIAETVLVRNCCGDIVTQTVVRAPREGEAEFKQCQCAERKTAEKEGQTQLFETRLLPTLICGAMNDWRVAIPIDQMPRSLTLLKVGRLLSRSPIPTIPPPRIG